MKKSYSQFTVDEIRKLNINIIRAELFEKAATTVSPSDFLLKTLTIHQEIPIESEKAKSELLITPILTEIRLNNPKKLTYFSGYPFNVDNKLGLTGCCDFIISKKYNAAFIESPVVTIVQAKQQQDLVDACPECIAQMYAAQLFNLNHEENMPCIYGSITNGYEWLFLKLENQQAILDINRYSIKNLPELLGVWQTVIDSF